MQIEVYITIRAFSNYERLWVENNSEVLTKEALLGQTSRRGSEDSTTSLSGERRSSETTQTNLLPCLFLSVYNCNASLMPSVWRSKYLESWKCKKGG